MSAICKLLAKSIGLSGSDFELQQLASPMHDIGKTGISDHILLKPGKLEPEERAIVQTHATIGAHVLEDGNPDRLRYAHDTALTHYENRNDSGYPFGLAGDFIPAIGRIAALADVFLIQLPAIFEIRQQFSNVEGN